jgi:hypothetical protein
MCDMQTVRFLLALGADARACSADTLDDFSRARSRLSAHALKLRSNIVELLREHALAAIGDIAGRPEPAHDSAAAAAALAAGAFYLPPGGEDGGALKSYEISLFALKLARAAMGMKALSSWTVCAECAAVAESE